MKKTLLFVALMMSIFSTIHLFAQSQTSLIKPSRMEFGFNLNQFENDFGTGINFTSPFFVKNTFAVRISGSYQWLQNIPSGSTDTKWSGYINIRFGVIGVGGIIANSIRLYGEGGWVVIVPNKNFSDKTSFGGYGLFGFEFFMTDRINYFIELGGIGTGATAEKLAGKPIYSNGFLISTGFRVSL